MAQLQEVFDRIKETKKEQREIKTIYRDALNSSEEYKSVSDELKTLKERKKQIEEDAQRQFSSEFTKLESLKLDIQTDMELLSDLAINQLVKGETVEVQDEAENKYEPVFSVRFKKAN
jgi:predicted nuclease with TOPRIM domain